MKREFLQNFSVNGQPLPKEVVDAILDEHSRDIGAEKADLEEARGQLQAAKDGLKAFDGVDVSQLRTQIANLQNDLAAKDAAHQKELADIAFDHSFNAAVASAKGRSAAAIIGELGTERMAALRGSKNQDEDIKAALEGLKKDSGYLFEAEGTPPPYAAGTGTGGAGGGMDGVTAAFAALNPGIKI